MQGDWTRPPVVVSNLTIVCEALKNNHTEIHQLFFAALTCKWIWSRKCNPDWSKMHQKQNKHHGYPVCLSCLTSWKTPLWLLAGSQLALGCVSHPWWFPECPLEHSVVSGGSWTPRTCQGISRHEEWLDSAVSPWLVLCHQPWLLVAQAEMQMTAVIGER